MNSGDTMLNYYRPILSAQASVFLDLALVKILGRPTLWHTSESKLLERERHSLCGQTTGAAKERNRRKQSPTQTRKTTTP